MTIDSGGTGISVVGLSLTTGEVEPGVLNIDDSNLSVSAGESALTSLAYVLGEEPLFTLDHASVIKPDQYQIDPESYTTIVDGALLYIKYHIPLTLLI